MVTVRVADRGDRGVELLGGGADLLDLAMLAAHAASALRRRSAGAPFAPEDARALHDWATLLDEAAGAVEFFETEGRVGALPKVALASRVDAALDAIREEQPSPEETQEFAAHLKELAERVRDAVTNPDPHAASGLDAFFGTVAASVLNETGHVGESVSTF